MTRALLALTILLTFASDALAGQASEFFAGKVEKFKARRVELVYDLSKPASLRDFDRVNPFLARQGGFFRVADGALRMRGVGALAHKGVFDADVVMELTITSKKPHDVGALLLQSGITGQFLHFSLADTFFCKRDRQAPLTHMITVIGAEDTAPRGDIAFRYLSRSREPALASGEPIDLVVRKLGEKNRMMFGKIALQAEDRYGKFPEVQPALFVLESEMVVTKLEIRGRLNAAWLDKKGIAWDPEEKDDGEVEKMEPLPRGVKAVAPEPRRGGGKSGRRGGRGRGGPSSDRPPSAAMALVGKLGDASLSREERGKAAGGLTKATVKYEEMRALIDLLASKDLSTRTLAIKVLKKVTRKTFDFHPKAPEDERKKAISKWYRYLWNNRERLRD